MSNIQTKLLGLIGTAVVFSGMAYGQATCAATALSTTVRGEGTNEVAGDVVITCTNNTGGPIGAAPNLVNVQVFFSGGVTVTSKLLDSGTGATEAVAWSTAAANGFPLVTGYVPAQAVSGTIAANGSLSFIGIPVPSLPTAGIFRIEVSNIRINASAVAVGTGAPPTITATAIVQGPIVSQQSLTAQQVAIVQYAIAGSTAYKQSGSASGFTDFVHQTLANLTTVGANNFPVCQSTTPSNVVSSSFTEAGLMFTLKVTENFPTAFRAATGTNSESSPISLSSANYPAAGSPIVTAGTTATNAANTNTRFKAVLTNIPNNVTIYVPAAGITSTVGAGVATFTSSETGAFAAGTPGPQGVSPTQVVGLTPLSITGGTAVAVFDITTPDPNNNDTYLIPFYAVAAASSVTPSSAISVAVSLAPTGSTNIPNFNASAGSTVTFKASQFTACATNLLFPFVSNVLGFDTGIAIANTSADPFGAGIGATAQPGTCTLNFYGTGAPTPANVTTANVPAGSTYTAVLSGLATGFQGYIIAQCQFQYAHGFAFITDGVGPNGGLSQGYLALVIPDVNQTPRNAGGGPGELLLQ
jgi:hypothetical protein